MSDRQDPNCIFCKIIQGKIPSRKVYEDEDMFAFHDINPWAPVHFLVIPKLHIPSMAQITQEHAGLLGRMLVKVPQEVHHLHWHVMGGPRPWLRG